MARPLQFSAIAAEFNFGMKILKKQSCFFPDLLEAGCIKESSSFLRMADRWPLAGRTAKFGCSTWPRERRNFVSLHRRKESLPSHFHRMGHSWRRVQAFHKK